MGKHLVYIASALAIVVVLCSIVSLTTDRENLHIKTNTNTEDAIDGIQIATDTTVTTNIWDYIRSQKGDDSNTVGASSSKSTAPSVDDEPELAITISLP